MPIKEINKVIGYEYFCDITGKRIREDEIFWESDDKVISIEGSEKLPIGLRRPKWLLELPWKEQYADKIVVIVETPWGTTLWATYKSQYYGSVEEARKDVEASGMRENRYYIVDRCKVVGCVRVGCIDEPID